MARCLIVGCGCRGRALAGELRRRGHVVRGTTRDPAHLPEIEACGAEPVLADPDRMSTLMAALDHVSVAVVLLGSAGGEPARVADLHGPRLEMLLHKLLDTTVRGLVYEASGTVPADVLSAGGGRVARACQASRIPYALITADPESPGWTAAALDAVERVLDAVS